MSKLPYSDYLESILAVTGGNIYWLDKNCVYQGCNDNVAKLFGLNSRRDIVGKTDFEVCLEGNGEATESFRADNLQVLQTKQAIYNIEEPPILDKDGKLVYFLTTRIPLIDDNGEVVSKVLL